jgi:TolB-like protein
MMAKMLRAILTFFLAVAAIPSLVFGDGSTTRPVKVAVVPFEVIGDAGHEWMGHAVQEGLATGLQKGSAISAVIVAGIVPVDANTAIAAGKSVDADVVIFGSVQVNDQTLRASGLMISVNTGATLGALKSDGDLRGLFEIEDLLSERASRILTLVKRVKASVAAEPVKFEIVGPTVSLAGPTYFDGNLASVIARPVRFGDDYDRYYYHSASTSGSTYYCDSCGGCYYGAGGCSGNGILCPIATPTRGW